MHYHLPARVIVRLKARRVLGLPVDCTCGRGQLYRPIVEPGLRKNEHVNANAPMLSRQFEWRFGNERAAFLVLMLGQRHEREGLAETACGARAQVSSEASQGRRPTQANGPQASGRKVRTVPKSW